MVTINDIVRVHGAALHAYACRLTGGDRHAAEDVVQETWLRAWRMLDRLTEERGSVRGWLMRVAHNVSVDQHRARRARPTEVGIPEQGLESTAVTRPVDEEVESRMVVERMLTTLPPAHRDTVVQVYFGDRTTAGAGKALGVPAGTVKSRLHHAMRTLRSAVPQLEAA